MVGDADPTRAVVGYSGHLARAPRPVPVLVGAVVARHRVVIIPVDVITRQRVLDTAELTVHLQSSKNVVPYSGHKRTTKIWAQFSAQTTQNLLRVNDQNLVLWAIDENMSTNLQEFFKHFYIGCLKTQKQQLNFVKITNQLIFLIFF